MKTLLKVLAGLAALLFVALIVLWILGGRTAVDTAQVAIAAPPEKVFSWIIEPDKAKQWMAGLESIKRDDDQGPRVGAKGTIVLMEQGEKFEMREEILKFEENRQLEVRITSPMFNLINHFDLTAADGQTQIQQTVTTQYLGFVRLFAPLMAGQVKSKIDADLAKLKQLVEQK